MPNGVIRSINRRNAIVLASIRNLLLASLFAAASSSRRHVPAAPVS
jgi:hypothetical protein